MTEGESEQRLDRLSAMVGRQLTKAEKWSYGAGKIFSLAGAVMLMVNTVPSLWPPPSDGHWEFQMLSPLLWLFTALFVLMSGFLMGPIDKEEWKICGLLSGVNVMFLLISLG